MQDKKEAYCIPALIIGVVLFDVVDVVAVCCFMIIPFSSWYKSILREDVVFDC